MDFFVFFFKKEEKPVYLKKTKNRWVVFFLKQVFLNLIVFQSFL